MKVYIVTMDGWEWTKIVGVFNSANLADSLALKLNAEKLNSGDTFKRNSTFNVSEHVVLNK